MLRALLIAVTLLGALPVSAARPKVRQWTDKDGVLHLDDTPQPQRARSTRRGERPGAKNDAVPEHSGRWWERRSDAPPDEIDRAAQLYNIPAELVRAVISAESDGDAQAVSRVGALGLMQLMPGTAQDMYVQDPVDPAQNILGGTRYLRALANQFNGDMMLTVAAYNAGPEAVRKYKGVPPFEETKSYVRKVIGRYQELKGESRQKKLASSGPRARTTGAGQ